MRLRTIPTRSVIRVPLFLFRPKDLQAVRGDLRTSEKGQHGDSKATRATTLSQEKTDGRNERDDLEDGKG